MLDEIRERHAVLLGLLEMPPAEEPPDTIRDVLIMTIHGHCRVDYYINGEFRHHGDMVRCWWELPPVQEMAK